MWQFLLAGTYGTVFKAKNRETHEIVALKRVRLDDDDEVRGAPGQMYDFDTVFCGTDTEIYPECFAAQSCDTIGQSSLHFLRHLCDGELLGAAQF